MTDQARGLLLAFVGTLFIVPDSLFVRLIDADAPTIVFWRGLSSGVSIFVLLFILYGARFPKEIRSTGAHGLAFAGCIAASGILFVTAVTLTSVATVVFVIAAIPVIAAILSRITMGERLSTRMAYTIAAVLPGMGLIALGAESGGSTDLLGAGLALAAACTYASGMVVARHARPKSLVPAIPLAYLLSTILVLPAAQPLSVDPAQWWLLAIYGGVFIAASTTLLTLSARLITAPELALLVLLESILAPILVWVLLAEYPGTLTLAGGAVIVAALAVSNFVALRRTSA
ncbi:MAG: DMT family transporter [Pseudomonadota bacterium]